MGGWIAMCDRNKDSIEQLTVGNAHRGHPDYYILRRNGKDIHFRCFGGTSFVRLEDGNTLERPTVESYHLWQLERQGETIEKVRKEETVFERID